MKDAAKLFAYFFAVVLGGALLAPPLFWSAHRFSVFFAKYDFESFFHRALLICALAFLWPFLRSLRLHSFRDLQLDKNRHAWRDLVAGILLAGIPLLVGAVALIATRIFLLKNAVPWSSLGAVLAAAIAVPLIEELFFRGLLLGILLRSLRPVVSTLITSGFFAIVHFLKAPTRPILPIGLHSGWIFVAGVVGKMTKRETIILPWLGTNLLIGLVPLALGLITWALMIGWLRYANRPHS